MNGNQDMQILEALIELKNQIMDLRTIFDNSLDIDSTEEETVVLSHAPNRVSNKEEYRIEITPQEMNELLFTPPVSPPTHHNPVLTLNSDDEIMRLRKDLSKFREKTEQEMNDLKKSVLALSEIFGRHELEIQKTKNSIVPRMGM